MKRTQFKSWFISAPLEAVFPDAGHMIPVDRSGEFARELLAFAQHVAM